MKEIKTLLFSVIKKAGEYAFKNVNKQKTIEHKEGFNNIVTNIDKKCEQIIIKEIKEKFPLHSILAEESGQYNKKGEIQWIIDPIDGTTNYAHGLPIFCTSIAVSFEEKIQLAAVYDPNRKELFFSEKGKGAFLNNKRINVSKTKKLKNSLIATGFAYRISNKNKNINNFKVILDKSQALRRPGSAAIDLCYVACGRFDGFFEEGLSAWDTAAGQLIVKEAGGTVTMLKGEKFDIFKKEILATNNIIHKEMSKFLKKS